MKLNDINPALIWPSIGRALAAAQRLRCNAADWIEAHNGPSAAVRILRSGVAAGTTVDGNWASDALGDTRAATRAFLDSLQTRSILARLFADNAITRLPFNQRCGIVSMDATAWILNEGAPTPLSRLDLASGVITPRKVAAMICVTDEFLTDASGATEQTFNRSLSDAVAKAMDTDFLSALMADTDFDPIASSGDDAEDALRDLRAALAQLQPSSDRLYWVGSRSLAIRASCIGNSGGRLFEAMGPAGGELLNLPFLVSNAVGDDDTLVLLDAAALCGDLGQIEMRASTQTSIQMDDSPTNDPTVPTTASLTSMFQTDSVALLATVAFGVEKLRPAVASIESINWGGTVTV